MAASHPGEPAAVSNLPMCNADLATRFGVPEYL